MYLTWADVDIRVLHDGGAGVALVPTVVVAVHHNTGVHEVGCLGPLLEVSCTDVVSDTKGAALVGRCHVGEILGTVVHACIGVGAIDLDCGDDGDCPEEAVCLYATSQISPYTGGSSLILTHDAVSSPITQVVSTGILGLCADEVVGCEVQHVTV